MRKLFPLLLGLCLMLTACGKSSNPISALDPEEVDPPPANIANPWTDHDTLEAAQAAVGFELSAPEKIENYGAPIYRTLSGVMLEILYPSENGEVRIRKQAATDTVGNDISGDYNEYTEHTAISAAGENAAITLDGNDGTISRAIWTVGDYAYSITIDPAVDVLTMSDLTAQVN